ncbi:dimethylsulfoniopropionate lyase [Rhodospirillales bacterium]|nr:dimethylsulfoniopropionate lyase [Rhodospirillales bacterium]
METLILMGGLVDQIIESHASVPSECSPLLHAFAAISDKLPWYTRHASDLPDFENGHINAEIIGPNGLEVRDDVLVGVTLMRPNLTYPDHYHPPEEVYIVLSEGLWRQNDAPWWSPGIGGYVYNPPNILHAMQSVETPLCAIWALNLK